MRSALWSSCYVLCLVIVLSCALPCDRPVMCSALWSSCHALCLVIVLSCALPLLHSVMRSCSESSVRSPLFAPPTSSKRRKPSSCCTSHAWKLFSLMSVFIYKWIYERAYPAWISFMYNCDDQSCHIFLRSLSIWSLFIHLCSSTVKWWSRVRVSVSPSIE